MKPICDYIFNELENKFIYIAAPKLVKELNEEATGVVAYVYINHDIGMCYEPLSLAAFDTDSKALKLIFVEESAKVMLTPKVVKELFAMILPENLPFYDSFKQRLEALSSLAVCSEEVLKTRRVKNLDGCRVYGHPDIIKVHLVKGDTAEVCHVRVEGIQEMSFYGILLQEPKNDFGIHEGDVFSFYNVKNSQGIMCLAVFK